LRVGKKEKPAQSGLRNDCTYSISHQPSAGEGPTRDSITPASRVRFPAQLSNVRGETSLENL
jgi:hypothetical protein